MAGSSTFIYFRKIGWISLALLIVAFSAGADTCPQGIVAYWRMEQKAPPFYDAVNLSDQNNADCTDRCPTSIAGGVVGGAVRFLAAGATGLEVKGNPDLISSGVGDFTIALWARLDGPSGGPQVLIGRGRGGFFWRISISPRLTASFMMGDGVHSLVLESVKRVSTVVSPLGARWHHIVVTRNGDSGVTRLYMDGLEQGRVGKSIPGAFTSNVAPLVLGWSGDVANAQRFDGSLDEVAIFNRVLEPTQIRSHYYLARHYCKLLDAPVRIMPVGDSITYDNHAGDTRTAGQRVAYRYALWRLLRKNGCFFDFVGSEQAGLDFPGFDPDNAGFPGILPSQLAQLFETSFNSQPEPAAPGYYVGGATEDTPYLRNFPCEVLLLHVGTVQLEHSSQIPNYINGVRALLEQVDRYSPHTTVLVAKIIHKAGDITACDPEGKESVTYRYNRALEQMVEQRIAAGAKLVLVDMEKGAGLTYTLGEDMQDDLHPNEAGYAKMAARWCEELIRFLPPVESGAEN